MAVPHTPITIYSFQATFPFIIPFDSPDNPVRSAGQELLALYLK